MTKDEKKKYHARYRATHKKEIAKYLAEYYVTHIKEIGEYKVKYYVTHKKEITEHNAKYYASHKKEIAKHNANYRETHVEEIVEYRAEYRTTHMEKIAKYRKERIKNDPNFKIATTLRTRLIQALKGNQKVGSAVRDLGCTIPELKTYLEARFQTGMTWQNHSINGWHIDHRQPLISFDLTDRTQLLQAVHYTNLQPLWAGENLRKWKHLSYELA